MIDDTAPEFVTVDLGDDCIATDATPSITTKFGDHNNNKRMPCHETTAAGLCCIILTISGLVCVPILVAPLGKLSANHSSTKNSTAFLESNSTVFLEASTTAATLVTTMNPHDVMQSDIGFGMQMAPGIQVGRPGTVVTPNPRKPPHPQDSELDVKPKQTSVKILCDPTSDDNLKLMLGPAFNPRYMSMTRPAPRGKSISLGEPVGGFQRDEAGFHKTRHQSSFKHKEFRVDGSFKRDLPKESFYASIALSDQQASTNQEDKSTTNTPANDVTPIRRRRSADRFISRIRRFSGLIGQGISVGGHKLRKPTTEAPKYPWECKSEVVWEDLGDDHFPRFMRTVKCLGDKCWFNHFQCRAKAFTVKILRRKSDQCVPVPLTGTGPTRYEQEWVYEERAVTFCCECVEL